MAITSIISLYFHMTNIQAKACHISNVLCKPMMSKIQMKTTNKGEKYDNNVFT